VLKTGVLVTERQLDGVEQNNPVTYLRSSGVPAMTVAFVGPGSYDASSARVGAFAQDAWDLTSRMVLDLGLRFDHDQHAGTLFGPRGGVTWLASDRVTVTAGLGWFAGELPLAALGFEGFQRRQVVEFDEAGVPTGPAVTDRHVVAAEIERTRARLASARVDWRIGAGWQLRGAVQERHGTREAIVERVLVVGQEALARLSTDGRSRTRSLEVTLGYRAPRQEHQVYLSYVTSSARGNTNDFGQVEGLFRDPRLAAPEDAPLPADVPHRVLAWGVFALPWQVTVAPFLDVRSGFPYSAVEDDWSYSGPRMSQRFPLFASLDLVVNKVATLPGGIRARVGIKLYNVVGRRNGRQIQADVDRPDFGRTYNALGRQVRGVFEIIWSGSRK
jgi:outer membrane receptor protein involved in Fe transport